MKLRKKQRKTTRQKIHESMQTNFAILFSQRYPDILMPSREKSGSDEFTDEGFKAVFEQVKISVTVRYDLPEGTKQPSQILASLPEKEVFFLLLKLLLLCSVHQRERHTIGTRLLSRLHRYYNETTFLHSDCSSQILPALNKQLTDIRYSLCLYLLWQSMPVIKQGSPGRPMAKEMDQRQLENRYISELSQILKPYSKKHVVETTVLCLAVGVVKPKKYFNELVKDIDNRIRRHTHSI